MIRALIALCLVFGIGGCLGNKMASPEVEFVKITKTKVVTETPEPIRIETEVIPEGCMSALKYAADMTRAAEKMYVRGDRQLEIISEARMKLASSVELAEVARSQRDLHGLLVDDLSAMTEAQYRYEVSLKKCEGEKP